MYHWTKYVFCIKSNSTKPDKKITLKQKLRLGIVLKYF